MSAKPKAAAPAAAKPANTSSPATKLVGAALDQGIANFAAGTKARNASAPGAAASTSTAGSTSGPNSTIIYPTVPPAEEDPAVRINVMKEMFKAALPPPNSRKPLDQGTYHEIQTAEMLYNASVITNGKQISRGLTAAEKAAGKKGTEQSLLVPMESGDVREIDMVCIGDPTLGPGHHPDGDKKTMYIVEAKNTQRVDTHQIAGNVQLAKALGAGVAYSLAGPSPGQEKAIRAEYPAGPTAPKLAVIHTPAEQFGANYNDKNGPVMKGLEPLPTRVQILRKQGVMNGDHFDPKVDHDWDPVG